MKRTCEKSVQFLADEIHEVKDQAQNTNMQIHEVKEQTKVLHKSFLKDDAFEYRQEKDDAASLVFFLLLFKCSNGDQTN
jgi:two-component SAPR family response regulator